MWVLDIWPETYQLVRVGRIPFYKNFYDFYASNLSGCDLILPSNEAASIIKKTSRNSIIKLLPNWVEPEYQEFKYASKGQLMKGAHLIFCMQET